MTIHQTKGTRMYIGPVQNIDTIKDAANDAARLAIFEAIIEGDWDEIEEIESLGDLGDNSEVATFAAVLDGRVTKLKTTRDAGTMVVVCAHDELDVGQIALGAAEGTDFNYAFRVVYNDARTPQHSPTTDYFAGLVMSRPKNLGSVQDVTKRTYNIGVNTAVITDPTDPTGS